jgi:hypothetical protein
MSGTHNEHLVFNNRDTGLLDLDGVAADTVTGGLTLPMYEVFTGGLCGQVTLTANTATLTLECYWQGSNDGTTWFDVEQPNSPAVVVWVTGTGSDVTKTAGLSPPAGVFAYRYARIAVVNRVAVGTTSDKYRIGYNFLESDFVA